MHEQKDLNLFYLFIALLKFHKITAVELNEVYLKKLVFDLISNINEIVEDSRINATHEDVNMLIFATFTEYKEIFVDNQELKALITRNE